MDTSTPNKESTIQMAIFVLLVEDNLDLSETITTFLELENMVCDFASSAEAAQRLLLENNYNVIILDIMLPKMSGLQLCKQLRASGNETPILMLTARDTLDDKLKGFHSGTDDYLVKPFDLPELVVRLQTLSKRKSGESKQLTYDDLILDLNQSKAKRGNRELKLTPIGWKILETLVRASPNPVSREDLMQSIWGEESPDSNSLKVHLHKLRKQLEGENETLLLQTIQNVGYAITNRK